MATILPPPGDNPNRAGVIGSGNTFVATIAPAPATDVLREDGSWGVPAPAPPPPTPQVQFIILSDPQIASPDSIWTVRAEDLPNLVPLTTFVTFWPISGVLGIVDDVGVRPARIIDVQGNQVTINFDISGLDVNGLKCVGVVYIGPQ